MGLGARFSNASHTAATRKRAANVPTETRFNLNERISGERPTDSIPLVKRRAGAIRALLGATRKWTPSLEHCMFDAVQLRTNAFDLNFIFYRGAQRDVRRRESVLWRIDPGRHARDRADADRSSGRGRAGQRCRSSVEQC